MTVDDVRPSRWWEPSVFESLSDDELRAVLAVNWWEPEMANRLSKHELAGYRALPYWRRRVSSLLTAEQRQAYETEDDLLAAERWPIRPTVHELSAQFDDDLDLVEAANQVMASLAVHRAQIAQLRREVLLRLDQEGRDTSELADALHTSMPRVRQLVIKAARDLGIPVREAYGNRRSDPR